MKDAFGKDLNIGDRVLGIANMNSTQTFYYGEVVGLGDQHANVRFTQAADAYIEEYQHIPDVSEKRIGLSHRLVKL